MKQKNLYNRIWKIETSYDSLKNSLEIERTTAKKRLTSNKIFIQNIVNYNLTKQMVKDAENYMDENKKKIIKST